MVVVVLVVVVEVVVVVVVIEVSDSILIHAFVTASLPKLQTIYFAFKVYSIVRCNSRYSFFDLYM